MADLPDRYPGTRIEKTGEIAGKHLQRGGMSASFSLGLSRPPPTCPQGDGGPRLGGNSRREERLRRRSGCDVGINERSREEGFFASLSPPFSGRTEVTREVD
jgi:hypothetical protein